MIERLSRLLDGDLDPAEAETMAAAIESDRALRRELESLARVRSSLHALAVREHPPGRLDTLVAPLLAGRPDMASARPWLRWLATAAVVVVGATVVFEVVRHEGAPARPNWQEVALEESAAKPTERFTLAPLPTAPANEQRPVSATDRLISAPGPEIETVLEPAPALEVLGPLDESSAATAAGVVVDGPTGRPPAPGRHIEPDTTGEGEGPTAFNLTPARSEMKGGGLDAGSAGRARATASEAARARAQLFVFMEAKTAWRSFEPDGPCEAGRYSLRVRIENGVVSAVWPVANPPAPARQVRASQLALGLEIADVADGEYSAEVVVEPQRPQDR